jgi:uncharacterized repeat protein (TIGR03803 family)
MKTSSLRVCALFAGCVVIVACSQTTELSRFQFTPSSNSVVDREASSLSYRVLHSFGADRDGNGPNDLIGVGDTFYGTTAYGGANYCAIYNAGCGTVFSITTDGKEKVLHNFGKGTDGSNPAAGLTDVGGTLYGTTQSGGTFGYGTVFSITTGGKEKVLHSFGNGRFAGKDPSADLIDVGGTLYGTTFGGGPGCGAQGCGTVFSISTDGRLRMLHRFGLDKNDGWYPDAGLTDVGGTLYSVTFNGGAYGLSFEGWGTVFSITTGGKEKVLHSFGDNDGWWPAASLVNVKGTLYGTTEGGGPNCGSDGCGTVFRITRGGSEKVLHSFNLTDGAGPAGSLIDVGGTLYGTTRGGGTNYCPRENGRCGTVFSITTGGKEKVLLSFRKGPGGNAPAAGLTYKSGRLFGTTEYGGAFGGGVLFSLTP